MDLIRSWVHKFLISLVLLTEFTLHGVDADTILTNPNLSPKNVQCVPKDADAGRNTAMCQDVHIVEFGPCGSVVELNEDLLQRTSLRIYFETIFEAADYAEAEIQPTPESMYAAVLMRENEFVEWIVLFRKLDYLIDGRLLMGSHTVFSLWHYTKMVFTSEEGGYMQIRKQSDSTPWMLYVLLVNDHRNLPLDCGEPPTRFDLDWIDRKNAIIVGAAIYTVVDTKNSTISEAANWWTMAN